MIIRFGRIGSLFFILERRTKGPWESVSVFDCLLVQKLSLIHIWDAANLSKDAVKGYLDKLLKGEGDTKLATTIKNGISNFMGGVVKNGVNAG